jgi:N-acetylated-alpha-linked acidic dipeptidase
MKILSFIFPVAVLQSANAQQMMGFSDDDAAHQLQWEKRFDSVLSPKNPDEWMRFISSHPHHAGSVQGKANAEYIANLFKKWGYDVSIENYDVLFPTPKERLLQLNGEHPYTARLFEDPIPGDKSTAQRSEQLPPFNMYSADGDVTAPLVFVNRGVPADYEELERL